MSNPVPNGSTHCKQPSSFFKSILTVQSQQGGNGESSNVAQRSISIGGSIQGRLSVYLLQFEFRSLLFAQAILKVSGSQCSPGKVVTKLGNRQLTLALASLLSKCDLQRRPTTVHCVNPFFRQLFSQTLKGDKF